MDTSNDFPPEPVGRYLQDLAEGRVFGVILTAPQSCEAWHAMVEELKETANDPSNPAHVFIAHRCVLSTMVWTIAVFSGSFQDEYSEADEAVDKAIDTALGMTPPDGAQPGDPRYEAWLWGETHPIKPKKWDPRIVKRWDARIGMLLNCVVLPALDVVKLGAEARGLDSGGFECLDSIFRKHLRPAATQLLVDELSLLDDFAVGCEEYPGKLLHEMLDLMKERRVKAAKEEIADLEECLALFERLRMRLILETKHGGETGAKPPSVPDANADSEEPAKSSAVRKAKHKGKRRAKRKAAGQATLTPPPAQNEKTLQERFAFGPEQATWDGTDLCLPTGMAVDVLRLLVKSFGTTVRHTDLDNLNSTKTDASETLRQAVVAIRKAFKRHGVPCNVLTKRSCGYAIIPA